MNSKPIFMKIRIGDEILLERGPYGQYRFSRSLHLATQISTILIKMKNGCL